MVIVGVEVMMGKEVMVGMKVMAGMKMIEVMVGGFSEKANGPP